MGCGSFRAQNVAGHHGNLDRRLNIMKGIMNSKKKAFGHASALGVAVVIMFVAIGASGGDPGSAFEVRTAESGERVVVIGADPPYLPSAQEVIQNYGATDIKVNPRQPKGDIVEVRPHAEIVEIEEWRHPGFRYVPDPEFHLGGFAQGFIYDRDLAGAVRYYDVDTDGVPTVGVTSRGVVEDFEELGIAIRVEIIDLDEVSRLKEVARQIQDRPCVLGASYCHLRGRIAVELTKPNWDRYKDIYREYPHVPLRFLLSDPQPEVDHGGGEYVQFRWGWFQDPWFPFPHWNWATSGFLASHADHGHVMVTAGHNTVANREVRDADDNTLGTTIFMIDEGLGSDAGFYDAAQDVTFENEINTWFYVGDDLWEASYDVGRWLHPMWVGQWIVYASGPRGLISGQVDQVHETYIRYQRSDGGPGDSGSPVFNVYWYSPDPGVPLPEDVVMLAEVYGVHTHGETWPENVGYATRIGRVQSLLEVAYPGVPIG